MYPVEFPEQNSVFVADGCDDLPACKQYNEQFLTDEVISLWRFSDDDLADILKQIKAGIRPAIHLDVIVGQPEYCKGMTDDEKREAFFSWCEENKAKHCWPHYYYPCWNKAKG